MWVAGYAGVFFSGLTLGLLPFFRAFFQGFREALDQARYKRDRPLYSGDFKTKEEWELYASQHPDQYELRHSDVPFSDVSKLFDDDYPGYDYWTAKDY
ncbi:MAG: hypothetical protein LBI63_00105 [Candidatus Ancillula sp.]|nr:hypothetical protein [Candidatus Ancillula sp.]